MNREQTVVLTRLVKAACPQQAMDRYTPDAWHDLLADYDFDDCRAAMKIIGQRQPFMAPAEIIAEVRRIRNERIARSVIPAPPAGLADDPRAYQRALQAATRQAGDGELPPMAPVIALPGAGRSDDGRPVTLGAAVSQLRKALGPGRPPRPAPGDERQIARDQAAALRAAREKPEGGKSA